MGLFVFVLVVGIIVYVIYKCNHSNEDNRQDYRYPQNNGQVANNINSNSQGTGMMVYFANDPHNLSDNEYRFSYKRVGNVWRAYILRSPSANGRTASCHRLSDNDGSYICWNRQIYSLREMQIIARRWADLNQKFIATGVSF